MRHLRFGIVCITPNSDPTRKPKYEVPAHVIYLKEVCLHEYDLTRVKTRGFTDDDFACLQQFYEKALTGDHSLFAKAVSLFAAETRSIDSSDFLGSLQVWDALTSFYQRYASDMSFTDFFWTWRGVHLPLLEVVQTSLPKAKIYHSLSTGYAGLLGAMGKTLMGGKYLITEHGIYTYERMLEIAQASWIYEGEDKDLRIRHQLPFLKKFWISMFKTLSHIAYENADRIFTLYEGNRLREISEGADARKITIIPNGIDLKPYADMLKERQAAPHIGFIGRVVNIKDVKTFIYAAREVADALAHARFFIIGPTTEEEEYFLECRTLVESLKLQDALTFTGPAETSYWYARLDVVVLTSVSEAQPLVILESNAAGIPVIATDVGACREMLEGRDTADRALGPSGIVTDVVNPSKTAAAIKKVLSEPATYRAMARSGKQRVALYYNHDDLLSRYLNIYEQNL